MADNGNSTPVDQRHPECIQISNTSLSSKLGWDFENNMTAHFNLKGKDWFCGRDQKRIVSHARLLVTALSKSFWSTPI